MKKRTLSTAQAGPTGESAPIHSDVASMGFEQALAELEAIVRRVEHPDTPLEESLRAFERGVALVRRCREVLGSAEQRFEEITRQLELQDMGGKQAERA